MENKKRLIYAEDVQRRLIDLAVKRGSVAIPLHRIINILFNESQTVNGVEVVHGRWILADDGDGDVCSVCGTDFCNIIYETGNWNYCPNCGAKMEA